MNRLGRISVFVAAVAFLAACGEEGNGLSNTDAILSDGVVSLAEYKQALTAESACVNQAGFQTTQLREQSDKIRWSFNVKVSDDVDLNEATSIQDSCYAQYVNDIEKVYYLAHVPTGADRDAMFIQLIECLDNVGVSGVSRTDTEQDIVKAIANSGSGDLSPGLLCLDQYRAVFPEGMFPE